MFKRSTGSGEDTELTNVTSIIQQLKREWSIPQVATHAGKPSAVPLVCTFQSTASEEDIRAAETEVVLPESLLAFWRASNGAMLFEDKQYGQWGLRLYSVSSALARTAEFAADRSTEYASGDLLIGEFLGDSDLLMMRCDPSLNSYGSLVVALPLDERAEWDAASDSLEGFLQAYADTHGEKFWRGRRSA
jgi:hypothetical protein